MVVNTPKELYEHVCKQYSYSMLIIINCSDSKYHTTLQFLRSHVC